MTVFWEQEVLLILVFLGDLTDCHVKVEVLGPRVICRVLENSIERHLLEVDLNGLVLTVLEEYLLGERLVFVAGEVRFAEHVRDGA